MASKGEQWLAALALSLAVGCGSQTLPLDGVAIRNDVARNSFLQPVRFQWRAKADPKLVYVTVPTKDIVNIYSFSSGNLVASITSLTSPAGECVDANGDIFIISGGGGSPYHSIVSEFRPGAASPIRSLNDPGIGYGCAVDATTQNLAVSNEVDHHNPSSAGDLAIYRHARGSPVVYYSSEYLAFYNCGYDGSGHVFIIGNSVGSHELQLAKLQVETRSFEPISLPVSLESGSRFSPTIQWHGGRLTVSSGEENFHSGQPVVVYRLDIEGSSGRVFGKTTLTSPKNLFGGQTWIVGKSIVGVYYVKGYANVGFWPYPKGGNPSRSFDRLGRSEVFGSIVSSYQATR